MRFGEAESMFAGACAGGGDFSTGIVATTTCCLYYLFFNYLYSEGFSAKDLGGSEGFSAKD